mgnify:CR=1 FL=1
MARIFTLDGVVRLLMGDTVANLTKLQAGATRTAGAFSRLGVVAERIGNHVLLVNELMALSFQQLGMAANAVLPQIGAAAAGMAGSIGQLGASVSSVATNVGALNAPINTTTRSLGALNTATSVTASRLAALNTSMAATGATLGRIPIAAAGAGGAMTRMGAQGAAAGNAMRGGMHGAEMMLMYLFAMVAGKGIKIMSDFDSQMREVNSIAGLSEVNYQKLRDTISQLTVTQNLHTTALDNAQGLYEIYSANMLKSSTDVGKATEATGLLVSMSHLATAGLSDMKSVADGVSTVLNVYGEEAGTATQVTDMMFQTVVDGKMKLKDYNNSIGYMLGDMKTAKISFGEANAALASLTDKGFKAERAARALSTSLKDIGTALNNSEKARETMVKYNLIINDTTIAQDGLVGTFKKIHDALGDDASAYRTLFRDQNAYREYMLLISDNLEILDRAVKNQSESAGAAMRAEIENAKSLQAAFKDVKNQMDAFLLSDFGEKIVEDLKTLASKIKELGVNLNSLTPAQKETAAGFVETGVGLGVFAGGLWVVDKIVKIFKGNLAKLKDLLIPIRAGLAWMSTTTVGASLTQLGAGAASFATGLGELALGLAVVVGLLYAWHKITELLAQTVLVDDKGTSRYQAEKNRVQEQIDADLVRGYHDVKQRGALASPVLGPFQETRDEELKRINDMSGGYQKLTTAIQGGKLELDALNAAIKDAPPGTEIKIKLKLRAEEVERDIKGYTKLAEELENKFRRSTNPIVDVFGRAMVASGNFTNKFTADMTAAITKVKLGIKEAITDGSKGVITPTSLTQGIVGAAKSAFGYVSGTTVGEDGKSLKQKQAEATQSFLAYENFKRNQKNKVYADPIDEETAFVAMARKTVYPKIDKAGNESGGSREYYLAQDEMVAIYKAANKQKLENQKAYIQESLTNGEISKTEAIKQLMAAEKYYEAVGNAKNAIDKEIANLRRGNNSDILAEDRAAVTESLNYGEINKTEAIRQLREILATHKMTLMEKISLEKEISKMSKDLRKEEAADHKKQAEETRQAYARLYDMQAKMIGHQIKEVDMTIKLYEGQGKSIEDINALLERRLTLTMQQIAAEEKAAIKRAKSKEEIEEIHATAAEKTKEAQIDNENRKTAALKTAADRKSKEVKMEKEFGDSKIQASQDVQTQLDYQEKKFGRDMSSQKIAEIKKQMAIRIAESRAEMEDKIRQAEAANEYDQISHIKQMGLAAEKHLLFEQKQLIQEIIDKKKEDAAKNASPVQTLEEAMADINKAMGTTQAAYGSSALGSDFGSLGSGGSFIGGNLNSPTISAAMSPAGSRTEKSWFGPAKNVANVLKGDGEPSITVHKTKIEVDVKGHIKTLELDGLSETVVQGLGSHVMGAVKKLGPGRYGN